MSSLRSPRAFAVFVVVPALALASPAVAAEPPPSALGYVESRPPSVDPWVVQRESLTTNASTTSTPPAARGATGRDEEEDDEKAREDEYKSFGGDIAFATEAPIFLGAQGTLKLPYGFLFQAELGALPSFYVDAVDGALVSANVYSEAVSSLVTSGLDDSFVMRLSAGMRPFRGHGFEILGGYTLTTLGGGVSARTALEAVAGVALPSQIPDAEIGLQSTLHSFHVSVGWRWTIADHFLVRTSIGYLQSVASSSHIEVPDSAASIPGASDILTRANAVVDSTLDENYKTYVKLPVFGLGLGYAF